MKLNNIFSFTIGLSLLLAACGDDKPSHSKSTQRDTQAMPPQQQAMQGQPQSPNQMMPPPGQYQQLPLNQMMMQPPGGQMGMQGGFPGRPGMPGFGITVEVPPYTQDDLDYVKAIKEGNARRVKSFLESARLTFTQVTKTALAVLLSPPV